MTRCLVPWLVLLAVLPGWCATSAAAAGTLTACDPSSVQAGEVVLLTLQGDLPPGSLTVEFFPQRITVLGVEPLDAQTLSVQVSVPLDAPAGAYNVLVYNQQGTEALGSQLLSVVHRVRAPRITSSEPQTIEAGLSEVKLTLHCDAADSGVVSHLHVDWTADGKKVDGITSNFSRDGITAIGLKLTGELPLGDVLGKVYFDTTPVYLVRLTRVDKEWSFLGHRPARAGADQLSLDIVLIGQGLTRQELAGCNVSLLLAGTPVATAAVQWTDNSSARARFSPVPHPGEYVLTVNQGATVFYQGPLTITGLDVPQVTPDAEQPTEPVSGGAAGPAGKPALPGWQEASAVGDKAEDAVPQPLAEPDKPAIPAPAPDQPAAAPATAELAPATVVLKPERIALKQAVYRVELQGLKLDEAELEAYTASLTAGPAEAELMFMGLGADSLVLLFKAPAGGWTAGAEYTLTVVQKATSTPLLARSVRAE
jgi:hypothetical protein